MNGGAVGPGRRRPREVAAGGAGLTLIEASAGTGKTRELTGLVARLVAVEDRRLDEVLVVTFTRAATAELRERIRGTFRSVRQALGTGEAEAGSQAAELVAGWRRDASFDPEAAGRRLAAALEDIDRANVYTIHGFCQRVLSDLAFDGGFPFEFEVSGDDTGLVAGTVRDFWRRRMYPASPALASHALENGFRPEELAGWVRRWRGKPDLRIEGAEGPDTPVEAREAEWQGALVTARSEWEEHREAFLNEVRQGSWLHRGRYRPPRTSTDLASIEALLALPEPRLPASGLFGRYGAGALAGACKEGHRLPDNPLFDAFDRLEEASARLRSAYDAWLRWSRREVLVEARESIRGRIREDRRLGYDDLLLELYHALRSAGGARLAERIRRTYPCALIDEFQDTDPVQAEVFMRIYGKTGDASGEGSEAGTEREGPDEGPGDEGPGEVCAPAPAEASGRGGPGRGSAPEDREMPTPGTDTGRVGPTGLCVVGDPKQSIYRFRGADVFAYLKARGAAHTPRSLTRNWRSVPALVEGVNAIFARANPFVVPEIEYPPAAPGREGGDPLRIEEAEPGGPLRFRLLLKGPDGKRWTKEAASSFAANAAAEEIACLLVQAEEGRAVIDEGPPSGGGARKLTGGDIAVLVRTRAQGRRVADALRERNVASVEVGDASVFDSREAEQMERLLRSLVEPGREARVRGALAGDLFGLDARRLHTLEEDEAVWAEWSDRMHGWRSDWEAGGIGPLLRRLVEAEGGAARLLRSPDGARRLTNVRHLTELLQAAEAEQRMAPPALAVWFSRRRAEERVRDEDTELRIESDEQLVRILTVHGAKGLEFPIVFHPFAWDARDPSRGRADHAAYHGGEAAGYPEVLDLEPDETARAAARREERSEELRLLYVALTRAKYRCVVTWGQVRAAERAPLAWLFHRPGAGPDGSRDCSRDCSRGPSPERTTAETPDSVDAALEAAASRFAALDDADLQAEVRALAGARPGSVSVTVLRPDDPARFTVLAGSPPLPLAARKLSRSLLRTRQLTSFSALAAEAGSPGAPVARPDIDRPDHDQHEHAEPSVEEEPPAEGESDRTAFTFPRGPAAGSCLHRIFEGLDEPPAGSDPDLNDICREVLAEFGFSDDWRDVARTMVERARAVRLAEPGGEAAVSPAARREGGGGFRLADPVRRLVELEFACPVVGLDRRRLADCLAAHGYPDPFPPGSDGGSDGGADAPLPIDGFLRGFIDLVVEHAGRWYIIDYKSNWLGPSPEDYGSGAVAAAMRSGPYPLQYLLYLVAVHRYLGLRLPGYDYGRHIGGVFYLFVRGMDPAAGMERGVWFDRPAASLVRALDGLFRGVGG